MTIISSLIVRAIKMDYTSSIFLLYAINLPKKTKFFPLTEENQHNWFRSSRYIINIPQYEFFIKRYWNYLCQNILVILTVVNFKIVHQIQMLPLPLILLGTAYSYWKGMEKREPKYLQAIETEKYHDKILATVCEIKKYIYCPTLR